MKKAIVPLPKLKAENPDPDELRLDDAGWQSPNAWLKSKRRTK
ncbi:MAG TPA: hypothetical protein VKU01_24640 [Bryobacteraceae bacterium]|nr:hypothetical protein [Bryobacteraceae bacterium]